VKPIHIFLTVAPQSVAGAFAQGATHIEIFRSAIRARLNRPNNVPFLKFRIIALLVTLGLSAGPAQAFGPMMLLMLPMMTGEQHVMGTGHGSDGENGAHTSQTSGSKTRRLILL